MARPPKETMSLSDHDLLIRLEAKFETFTSQYHLDMKNLNDGITRKVTENTLAIQDQDKRLRTIEAVISNVRLEETYSEYLLFRQEVRDLLTKATTTANVYRMLAGFIGGAVVWLITSLPSILSSWGIIK